MAAPLLFSSKDSVHDSISLIVKQVLRAELTEPQLSKNLEQIRALPKVPLTSEDIQNALIKKILRTIDERCEQNTQIKESLKQQSSSGNPAAFHTTTVMDAVLKAFPMKS